MPTPLNLPENTNIEKGKVHGIMKSPEVVRPYPKALPRKKTGGRKLGSTRILTDWPEKNAIDIDYKIRELEKKQKLEFKEPNETYHLEIKITKIIKSKTEKTVVNASRKKAF